jgi:hypothetical protein
VGWLAAWEVDGTARWSVHAEEPGRYSGVAVDDVRIVVTGTTAQPNTPSTRAVLARYEKDGALVWSEKLSVYTVIGFPTLVGEEVAVLANAVYPWWAVELARFGDTGELLWSIDLTEQEGTSLSRISGLTHDGDGGTWTWGEDEDGPWAARHDDRGALVDRLDCSGGTAGWLTHLAVGPQGQLAVGVLVTTGPIPIVRATPWIARIEDGVVVSGARFDDEQILRMYSLDWLPDGRLAAGIHETNPDLGRMVIVR